MANISVWFDKEEQIIVQRIEGSLDLKTLDQVMTLSEECAAQLENPGDIRILVDTRGMIASDLATRRRGAAILKEKNVKCMAFWGAPPFERTLQRLMMIIIGEKRMRLFATEQEARAWLKANRPPSGSSPAQQPGN